MLDIPKHETLKIDAGSSTANEMRVNLKQLITNFSNKTINKTQNKTKMSKFGPLQPKIYLGFGL